MAEKQPTPTPNNKTSEKKSEAMTLDEIRMQLIVNSMKLNIEKQKLIAAISPTSSSNTNGSTSTLSRIENLIQYATLAATAYRFAKKGVAFFKSFRK
jgi:hypothetical protein